MGEVHHVGAEQDYAKLCHSICRKSGLNTEKTRGALQMHDQIHEATFASGILQPIRERSPP